MPVRFKCPTCGSKDSAPDEMAGKKIHCRKCGQKIKLPERKPFSPVRLPTPEFKPTSSSAAPTAPGYQCSVCHNQFAVSDVYDQDGVIICKSCFDAQQAEGEPPPAEADFQEAPVEQRLEAAIPAYTPPTKPPAPAAKKPPYALWIGGGVAALVALIVIIVIANSHHSQEAQNTPAPSTPAPTQVAVAPVAPTPVAPPPPDWETLNMPKMADLRRQAQDQENSGDLKAASATYEQLVNLAKSDPNPSDAVIGQLAVAQSSWEAVLQKLSAAQPTTAPTPDSTSVAQTPTTPTPAPAPQTPAASGNWEQQHTAQIKQLLKQAEAKLAAKDSFNAALIYQQLFEMVGAHLSEISDPKLRQQIADAAQQRGKLLVQVRSSPQSLSLTAGTLLASGLAALNENRWEAGLECLSDVRALFDRNVKIIERNKDPNYLLALDGMAVAYLKLKEVPKAGDLFEDDAPLGAAAERQADRDFLVNRAVLDIIQKTKAMRAAKSLKIYLEKHPNGPPDETILNLLGTSLFVAEQHTMAKGLLDQCAEVYQKQNTRLEETRPGEKRWGVEWLPAGEVDKKMGERKQQLNVVAQLRGQAAAAYREWENQQRLFIPQGPQHLRQTTQANVNAAESAYNRAEQAVAEAEKKIPPLPWLTDIQPVLPPLPKGMTAVAAAVPAESGSNSTEMVDTGPSVFTVPNVTLNSPSSDSTPTVTVPTPPPSDTSSAPPPPPKPVHISIPRHALAVAIDKTRLVSSADIIGNVTQVRMEDANGLILTAHVVAHDERLALLELDPGQVNALHYQTVADNFAGGAITCTAVPQENVFGPQPVSLSGQAAPPPPQAQWAVSLSDNPRLPGSPLFDAQGQLVGLVIAKREDVRTRLSAVSGAQLKQFLTSQSALPAGPSGGADPMSVFEVTVQEN